ncbi:MAG: response regulator [Gammaproteobacteria bacterium]|nr:response regulator [Gammaproteobacteria bacterium]
MERVLIIDDSATDLHLLNDMLSRNGFAVLTASNGEDGIQMARAERPDAILMDVVMPEMNGFEATRALSKDPQTKDIPVLIVSSKDQETDRVWGMRQGAKDYLVKPVNEKALVSALRGIKG